MGYRLRPEEISQTSDERKRKGRPIEMVLIMQGGGSLGTFGCGVYKALVKKEIRIGIAARTSIGAVNAAIIVGSKSGHPENDLEDFWKEIAESNHSIIPDSFTPELTILEKFEECSSNIDY